MLRPVHLLLAAAGFATTLSSVAQPYAPNLITYGTFEEPFGTCPFAPASEVPLKPGYNCNQQYPTCGSTWWMFQRHNTIGPPSFKIGTVPSVHVLNSVPDPTIPVPYSGSRIVAIQVPSGQPAGGHRITMHQNLSTPLIPGHTYFMRWRFKALASQPNIMNFTNMVFHGVNTPCSVLSPNGSLLDYPGPIPHIIYEPITSEPQMLNGQIAKTFTATQADVAIGLRFYIQKNNAGSSGTLYLDDFELYDTADGDIPPLVDGMVQLNDRGAIPPESRSLEMTNKEADQLSAWPNPSNGTFLLVYGPGTDQPGQVTIHSTTGALVRRFTTLTENSCTIDLGEEPAGVYHISYTAGNVTRNIRAVKE